MAEANVELGWEHPSAKVFMDENELIRVIQDICHELELTLDHVAFLFMTDEYLKELHAKYLNDDTYTDVITFDLRDEEELEAEIYISVDRAIQVSRELNIPVGEELLRYMIHGLLHLAGYDDQNDRDAEQMKKRENDILERYVGRLHLRNS